jgi:hypothetical protein
VSNRARSSRNWVSSVSASARCSGDPGLLEQPGLDNGRIANQPLDNVQPQQRLDGAAQGCTAGGVLGQRADLLAVEKEELRDFQRHQLLDHLRPASLQRVVDKAIAEHQQGFAQPVALDAPFAPDFVLVRLALRIMAEAERDLGPLFRRNAVVDRLPQEVLVGQVGTLGAASPRTVERELDGVKQRRLAAAVDAAEEENRPIASVAVDRLQVKNLVAMEEAEVSQFQLFQNHGSASLPVRPIIFAPAFVAA